MLYFVPLLQVIVITFRFHLAAPLQAGESKLISDDGDMPFKLFRQSHREMISFLDTQKNLLKMQT